MTANSLNINDSGLQDFDSSLGQFTATSLTTKGDLLGFTGSVHQRFPVGQDGYVLKADSDEDVGWRWACPAFEFIDSQTASSSSSIEFTDFADSDCYNGYKIIWRDVEINASAHQYLLRFSIDNGTSWLSSNYQWSRNSIRDDDGQDIFSYSSSDASIQLQAASGSSQRTWRNGEMFFFSSADPTNFLSQGVTWTSSFFGSNSQFGTSRGFAIHPTASQIDGFQFRRDSGNIDSGIFYLYGMLS